MGYGVEKMSLEAMGGNLGKTVPGKFPPVFRSQSAREAAQQRGRKSNGKHPLKRQFTQQQATAMGSRMISHSLPPLCRYSALFAASQPGNALQRRSWRNNERIGKKERSLRQHNKKKKGKKNKDSKQNARSDLRSDGLGKIDADL
jgi:hypothetical protein